MIIAMDHTIIRVIYIGAYILISSLKGETF